MTGSARRTVLAVRRLVEVLAIGLLFSSAGFAHAAVEVGASLDRNRTALGEQVVLSVLVTGECRDVRPPKLPQLPDFSVFGGGQSQRFSFVNGKVAAEHSFNFYLQPKRSGKFTIEPIEVVVDGVAFRTRELELEVTAAGSAPPTVSPGTRDQGPSATSDAAGGDDAFVMLTVDRDSVVVGEQLVLTFGFYRATRMSAFESPEYTPPRTEGFWREDLPPESHTSRVIRSRRYYVTEIQYALFPTRAGELVIEPATVRLPEDPFDAFLRRSAQPRRGARVLTTDRLLVRVAPLPQPAPVGFAGAVGSGLRLDASVDRREVDEGDAVTLRLRLQGMGHLPGMPAPQLDELDGFRIHDAGGGADSRPQNGKLTGSRVVERLLLPQRAGTLQIPSVRYVYFDTDRREYVTLRTQPIDLEVRAVEGGTTSVFAGGRRSEIELLSRDILHIVPLGTSLRPWAGPLPERPVFWGLLVGPALVWGASAILARRRALALADPRRVRARRALGEATKILGSEGAAEQRVVRAVHGWVADRFDRAAAGLTHDEVERLLRRSGVDESEVRAVAGLLARCDAARFAPSGSSDGTLVDDARVLLSRLEEALGAH